MNGSQPRNHDRVAWKARLGWIGLQVFLVLALYYVINGWAFLIGWEQVKPCRDLHKFLRIAAMIFSVAAISYYYVRQPDTFAALVPVRFYRTFMLGAPALFIAGLSVIYFVTQLSNQVWMHGGLETALWDFGFYDQVLWNTAHGGFLITSVRGGLHIFAEHFKPMLAILSLVYRYGHSVFWLFFVTTALNSGVIALSYLICRTVSGSVKISLALALCVFFYQPFINGINFLFHTQMLADPLLLAGFYLILRRQACWAAPCLILALMCKESVGIDLAGLGLFLIARKNKNGFWMLGLAALTVALFSFWLEPHYRYAFHHVYKWSFFGNFTDPTLEKWLKLLTPNPLWFLVQVFGPFLFLSFVFKGWVWLLAPSILFRLLSVYPGFRLVTAHYTGGLNALVFISAIYGLDHLNRTFLNDGPIKKIWSFGSLKQRNLFLMLLVTASVLFNLRMQTYGIDKFLWEASKPEKQRIVGILRSIPPDYSVLTNERFSAHLTHRPYLFVFFSMFERAPYEKMEAAPDLIIADEERISPDERKRLDQFLAKGYVRLHQTAFMMVYQNPSAVHKVPDLLIERWREIDRMPGIPYRNRFRQFYFFFSLAVFLIFIGWFGVQAVRWRAEKAAPHGQIL